MNVLGLFDGMSCGQIALRNLKISVDNYFAAEIKEHAIRVTKDNFPETRHLGDIRKIQATDLPQIDLLLGGSPCQDFSRLNSERAGLEGEKSRLFFEYLRLLEECAPKYFLLENIVMEEDQACAISRLVGCAPVRINAARIGPVHRDRLYWTNIPGDGRHLLGGFIKQPKSKDISFQSILTEGFTPAKKGRCINCNNGGFSNNKAYKKFIRWRLGRFGNLVFVDQGHFAACAYAIRRRDYDNPIFEDMRVLNKTELERCHEIPEGYCGHLTSAQTEDVVGDGWHVGVIEHLLKNIE